MEIAPVRLFEIQKAFSQFLNSLQFQTQWLHGIDEDDHVYLATIAEQLSPNHNSKLMIGLKQLVNKIIDFSILYFRSGLPIELFVVLLLILSSTTSSEVAI